MHSKTIGLILAGGRARRFGGGKALALLKGKPLLLWVKEALGLVCDEVWISLREPEQPEASLKTHFNRTVWDPFPGEGPLSGLLGALHEMSPGQILLAASCDQPLLQTSLLKELLRVCRKGNYWAVFCLNHENEPEPLPGLYGFEVRQSLEAYLLSGRRSLKGWLRELPRGKVLGLPFESWYSLDKGLSFININRKEDLRQAERLLN